MRGTDNTRNNLSGLADQLSLTPLSELYLTDKNRFSGFSIETGCLLFDFSKQRVNTSVVSELCKWAEDRDVRSGIKNIMSGDVVNVTEERQALHTVLRASKQDRRTILGDDRYRELADTDDRMKKLSEDIDSGNIRGEDNKFFSDIVVLGIGGSILGPKLVYEALSLHHKVELNLHFVSSLNDGTLTRKLRNLDPESTLCVTISKTFTTQETLQNSIEVRQWFEQSGLEKSAMPKHLIAVTANTEMAKSEGYREENIFPLWDWVGGRFSLWSAVGLPLVLGLGWEVFDQLRQGAHYMDMHAIEAEYQDNMPVMLALLSLWNREYLGSTSVAVLPYGDNLGSLPDYLQQLEMESNGKEVDLDGNPSGLAPASIVWGREGSNAQHSFMQRIHQCGDLVPVDFVLGIPEKPVSSRALEILISNCIAQSEVLMTGRSREDVYNELVEEGVGHDRANFLASHKAMPGNNPSSTIVLNTFSAYCLGSLLSLYENKTIVESILMNTNPFDQWGVELGKRISCEIESYLHDINSVPDASPSKGLVRYVSNRLQHKQDKEI